jgi:hypothetical protein
LSPNLTHIKVCTSGSMVYYVVVHPTVLPPPSFQVSIFLRSPDYGIMDTL